ncbi:MAG: hypothetical protein NVSMB13_08900 [Mycobacteriales bacterium]
MPPAADTRWLDAHQRLLAATRADPRPVDHDAVAEVRDLLTAYAVFYDAGDVEAILSVFAPDATYTTFLGTFHGTAELRANFTPLVKRYRRAAHLLANVTVHVRTAEQAEAASYLHAVVQTHDGVAYSLVGSYEDTLVRRDGSWLIANRTVHDGLAYTVDPIEPANRLGGHDE